MRTELLLEIPWFASLDHLIQAQLAIDIQIIELKSGESLFTEGAIIEDVHYVVKGNFLKSGQAAISGNQRVERGFFGHEVVLSSQHSHPFSLVAEEESIALKIRPNAFSELISKDHRLRSSIFRSVIFEDTEALNQKSEINTEKRLNLSEQFWWIASIISPVILYYILNNSNTGIDRDEILFACVVLGSLVLWIGELTPILAPALLIIIGLSLLEIAPPEIILSGFGNSSFLFMIALFVIGGLIKSSGLAFRFCLMILSRTPQNQNWLAAIMFFIGLILNPILPSATSRNNVLGPILIDIKKNLKLNDRSPLYTMMSVSLFSGISTFSFVFISAKSDNLILFALLPPQVREAFGYGDWLLNSLFVAAPLLILSFALIGIIFKHVVNFRISRDTLNGQIKLLGKLSSCEWSAIGSIFIFVFGTATTAIHGFSMIWVSMLILCYLLLAGTITGNSIKSMVDWPFLLFLASLIGLSNSIPYSSYQNIISESLQGMSALIASNIYLFTIVFGFIVYGLRLFLPGKLCTPLLATIFIPLFSQQNVNPWILCIMCLVFSDAAFFPYQHPPLSNFLSVTQSKQLLDTKSFFKINWIINIFRILAVLMAIPLWRIVGIS